MPATFIHLCCILFLFGFFAACKNNYRYTIGADLQATINADNDSAAYIHVFTKYVLIRKFYEDAAASGDRHALGMIPDHFALFNAGNKDITNDIHFVNKTLAEEKCIEQIYNNPAARDDDKSYVRQP
jgi:hypothetical protein